jgi:tRNA A37 threonylcarbamoyladenosine modification protein TsaB
MTDFFTPLNDHAERELPEVVPLIVCPVFDARRSQMYAGAYLGSETLVPGGAYAPEDFLSRVKDAVLRADYEGLVPEIVFCGDGLGAYAQTIEEQMAGVPHSLRTTLQRATAVLRWAAERGVAVDYRTVEPIYMRQAEAQRKLEERLAKGKDSRFRGNDSVGRV